MNYTISNLVKAKNKMALRGLYAFYSPVRKKWIISNNLTTLLYAVVDSGVRDSFQLVAVEDTGRVSNGANKRQTARWLESPQIVAIKTKHKITFDGVNVTLANRWYKVTESKYHLSPVTDEEWDLR